MTTNKITKIACLLGLIAVACTKSAYAPDYSGNVLAATRNEALNLLPEDSRLRYEAWKAGLVKGCTVTSIFDGNMEGTYVDLKMFFAQTNNSLFLLPKGTELPKDKDGKLIDWENSEFVLFGQPNIPQEKASTEKEIATTKSNRNAKVKLATNIENGICEIYVGGFKVDSIVVASQVPTIAHSSPGKREQLAKSQNIQKSEVKSQRGVMRFSDGAITAGGYASLSVQPFFMGDPDNGGQPINPDQQVIDLLLREFGSLQRHHIYQHFSMHSIQTSNTSVEFVGRTNEFPFGFQNQFFYGYERRLRDLRDVKKHNLTTQWRIKPALVKIPDPENPGAFVGNEEVDKHDWVFEVETTFDGSIDEGGKVELKKFVMKAPTESTRESAAACFAKRSFAARTIADKVDSVINVYWNDIVGPCLAHTKNIMKDILESANFRTTLPSPDGTENPELTAIEEFRTILRLAKLEQGFNYGGWDYQFKELVIAFLDGDPEKNISDLDPANNVPLIQATKQNYVKVKDAVTDGGSYTDEFKAGLTKYLELALQATFKTFDLNELKILELVRDSAKLARGILVSSYRNFIEQLSGALTNAPKEGEPKYQWENLQRHVAKMEAMNELPDDTEAKLQQVSQLARKLGLDGWAQSNPENFLRLSASDINAGTIGTWSSNLQAMDVFLAGENTRLGGSQSATQERWRSDFKIRFMMQAWNALTLQYLTRFSNVVEFIPECAAEKEIIARLWCTNASNISSSTNGVLFPESRDRLWELSNEFARVLPRLSRGDEVAARVARHFFSPMFQNCKAEAFRIKVKNLMSVLVRYARNPAAEKAQPDFESRLGTALAACN